MRKRILSILLVAVTLLTTLPANFITAAAEPNEILYGDANGDGEIGLLDDLILRRYDAGQNPSGFVKENADVNDDGKIDLKDVLMVKKYLAGWEIVLGPEIKQYTVTFYDGDRVIDMLVAEENEPLGKVPEVNKSSKANAILVGYYLDKDYTLPFYAENPVTSDMVVYAKYEEMESIEDLTFTSFAQMDQSTNVSFTIKNTNSALAADEAVTLIPKDGSDPVALKVSDEDGDGVYTVTAPEGFKEGASYELTLADGWVFDGKEETIRTAAFSIKMEEVENLQMSDDIVYIEDTDTIKYAIADGTKIDVLTSSDIDKLAEGGNGYIYSYADADELNKGDILCIYVGVNPNERDPKKGEQLLDPVVYVKVKEASGTVVTFEALGEDDQQNLYEIPDNFPIKVPALPTGTTGTVNIGNLDVDFYKVMMGEEATKESALEAVNVGDFITLYISTDDIEGDDDLYFGKITAYNAATGDITYVQTTAEEIEHCMDLYVDAELSGDDIITDEEAAEIEKVVLGQLQESNFGEEAAFLLADLITKTEGFRNSEGVVDFILTDENGNELTDEQIALLNIGGSFELSDDIELTVELINKGEQLHFKENGGIQLAIGIEAEFEVEVEEGKIAIKLSASFVEEVAIDPSVSGSIVKKKILGIPIPVGVKVGSTIDVRNYTAFSFEAEIYTVEEEDEDTWTKIQNIMNDPTEILGSALPDKYADVLKNVGDVMDKIDELEAKIDKASETVDTIKGYQNDVAALWAVVEGKGITDRETWEQMEEALGKTNVASDLLDLMNMTTETGITTEYIDTFQGLMDKYTETVQKETDWVKLVEQEIFSAELNIYGVVIGVSTDFVVRADMSIAIGSNLEYEVGKRYNFWFKIGLFKPEAGSSTMDLIDEKFAFQFYVMGRMGLKAGVEAKFYVGIGSGKLASVGITAELGPYLKLYGFYVYEYTKYRPANSADWTANERMAGAMFLEFGLYFMLGFEAEALGLFEYSYDFLDEEVPLLTAGQQKYYYDFSYEPAEDEMVVVRDEDGNSTNGITAKLRDSLIALNYLNLTTGYQGEDTVEYDKYNFTLSNPNFTMDKTTGIITVNVPENTRVMECDLTVTYKLSKLAFTQYDMTVTIPLVWTNLSDEELKEYYSASVRVGNDKDGYETVWSKRVLKNQQYDLPTVEEIKELIGWNEYKYVEGTGYGDQILEGLTLIEDEVYDFNVEYRTYSITVNGIQNADGTTTSKTFTAKYGESFDFSELAETGTYIAGKTYTKFAGVETNATIMVNGKEEVIDLSSPINAKVADALINGITATANYVDNSVKVTFTFAGKEHADVEMLLNKGETPELDGIDAIASDLGLAIKETTPVVNKVFSAVTYEVVLGELNTPFTTITFVENGGKDVADIEKREGSLIGTLPTPVRDGYTFGGWYTDNGTFQTQLTSNKVPVGGVTLYAKWTANEYTVNFHVNGGNALTETDASKKVTFGKEYGTFPTVTKNGYGFIGWFTAENGGVQVKETDIVNVAADQTLYAQWKELKEISKDIFDFGEAESGTYEKGKTHEVIYNFTAQNGETYKLDDFTFKYMIQGATDYAEGLPVGAGTYNVTISRPADNDYAKFEYTYEAVITIDKATRDLSIVLLDVVKQSYTTLELKVADGAIDDLSSEATFIYYARKKGSLTPYTAGYKSVDSVIRDLTPETKYEVVVKVMDDPNYLDVTSVFGVEISTKEAPTDYWTDEGNYDILWYDANEDSFEISTAAQLAGVSYLLSKDSKAFNDKTVQLTADIDLRGHEWDPIDNFFGTFDGNNHTINGMYIDNISSVNQGLFGMIIDTSIASRNVSIKNIRLDDAYIRGREQVGGIVGAIFKINSSSEFVVENCVSYADVYGAGYDADADVGGIVGAAQGNGVYIKNCENYGEVSGGANHLGGIVGYILDDTTVANCANFGEVDGNVSCVGGIVGQSDEGNVYNCYNVGIVIGKKKYIGAIVGRNTKDKGTVHQCYYWESSAGAYDDDNLRKALGTEKGSLGDGKEGTKTASFSAFDYILASDCGYGKNLLDALTKMASDKKWASWEEGPDGFPIIEGLSRR